MNNASAQHADLAVRASDSEREQTVALLQRSFADGRLTQAELEERAGAAYAARTRAQLRDLTADLPDAGQPSRSCTIVDLCLLIILVCVCPPAGLACWLLCLRGTALPRAWLMNARPWQRLLAGAIIAGAGMAFEVLSHLARAVLVSAGVIVALPAISGPLHRMRVAHEHTPAPHGQLGKQSDAAPARAWLSGLAVTGHRAEQAGHHVERGHAEPLDDRD